MPAYKAPTATEQQLLLRHHSSPQASANLHVQKVLHRLKICRTAALVVAGYDDKMVVFARALLKSND